MVVIYMDTIVHTVTFVTLACIFRTDLPSVCFVEWQRDHVKDTKSRTGEFSATGPPSVYFLQQSRDQNKNTKVRPVF